MRTTDTHYKIFKIAMDTVLRQFMENHLHGKKPGFTWGWFVDVFQPTLYSRIPDKMIIGLGDYASGIRDALDKVPLTKHCGGCNACHHAVSTRNRRGKKVPT